LRKYVIKCRKISIHPTTGMGLLLLLLLLL
jgi:hypothetical protein